MCFELDFMCDGFNFKTTEKDKGDSLVTISKEGKTVREFLWPTYKIFNISAHAQDIVDGLKDNNDDGLRVAGSNGLGGNVYK